MLYSQLFEHLDISYAAIGCIEMHSTECPVLRESFFYFVFLFFSESTHAFYPFLFSEYIYSLNSTYHEVYMFLSHQAGPLSLRTPVWGNCGAISHSIQG